MASVKKYNFPVNTFFEAARLTDPNFDITNYWEDLYVELDGVRSGEQFNRMRFDLGLDDQDNLVNLTDDYIKIMFAGHVGCGKSTELYRLNNKINHKEGYFSIFLDFQQQTDINYFEAEDFYVMLISAFMQRLAEETNIEWNTHTWDLNGLANDWIGDKEIKKELENSFGFEANAEVTAGFSFWQWLSIKSGFKALFSSKSKTVEAIRRRIKTNPNELISRFNTVIRRVRQQIISEGIAKDIIFVVDGSEKLKLNKYDVYEQLFIRNALHIQSINANMIFGAPIDTLYDITHVGGLSFYKPFILPMIRIDHTSIPVFRQIITNRISESDIVDTGVIDYCAEKSGGNPRQFIRILNTAIRSAAGKKVTKTIAEKAVIELGNLLLRSLTSKHKEILKSRTYDNADKDTLDLLFSLCILEYNGNDNRREINPLLAPLI
jgi:energy-coupling factor transporter ATP-binding protein EcfA2